jgi:uncharacterized protein (DUF58 family)
LYVPGIALLLIAAAAVAWVSTAARGVRLARSLGGPAVQERVDLPITVSLVRSHLPLPGAELRAWDEGPALPLSRSGDAAVAAVGAVRFERRGRRQLGPAALLVADPLGLCSRVITSAPDQILVLPRIEPVRSVEVGGESTVLGRRVHNPADAGPTEVDSLRPHRPGTPASRIHWPTVARTTTLVERRLVADGDQSALVVLDPREPSSANALDQAMRAAASLCVHLARRGGCALLLPGDRRPTRIGAELYGFSQLHARLAVLEPEAGGPPLGCLSGASVVLWVTAASGRSASLAQVRAPVRYRVSPHAQVRWPVQFTVAGCSGQRLERHAAVGRAA